jgi:hypothetical protein
MTWQPSNEAWSEQYRIMGELWAEAEAAASLLEDTKSAVLAQHMIGQGDIAVNKAEMIVKASREWREHIGKIAAARKEANLLKVRLEYCRMKYHEEQGLNATQRAEMRMTT